MNTFIWGSINNNFHLNSNFYSLLNLFYELNFCSKRIIHKIKLKVFKNGYSIFFLVNNRNKKYLKFYF